MSIDFVRMVREKYPTPLGSRHAEFLLEVARKTERGLLRKPTGTNILLPDGTRVAQDILCEPDGQIYDILIDGEGEAKPQWSPYPEKVPVDRYYPVSAVAEPEPEPEPDPEQPNPIVIILAKLDEIIAKLSVPGPVPQCKFDPENYVWEGRIFGYTLTLKARKVK